MNLYTSQHALLSSKQIVHFEDMQNIIPIRQDLCRLMYNFTDKISRFNDFLTSNYLLPSYLLHTHNFDVLLTVQTIFNRKAILY